MSALPTSSARPPGSEHAGAWPLDPGVVFLNHGSFGACPSAVLERQAQLRRQLEAEPVQFLMRTAPPLLDRSREQLGQFVGAPAEDLVFVRNATSAVNAVLRSIPFQPGDEILVTDHEYNACRNAVDFIAARCGCRVVVAHVPVPLAGPEAVVEAMMAHLTPRTRLAMLDHVTSPTAIAFPVEPLVRALAAQGVDALVDGAHAPGMIPLDLARLGAAYYTGNCHKWLCAPKGAAFLYVRPDRQEEIHPNVISHGLNRCRPGAPRWHDEFDWTGTDDPTPWICVGEAIAFLDGLAGGMAALMARNHELATAARAILCNALGAEPLAPESMLGSMAAVRLPEVPGPVPAEVAEGFEFHPLQNALYAEYGIETPVLFWPAPPTVLLRVSAAAYNSLAQYEYLAQAVARLLK